MTASSRSEDPTWLDGRVGPKFIAKYRVGKVKAFQLPGAGWSFFPTDGLGGPEFSVHTCTALPHLVPEILNVAFQTNASGRSGKAVNGGLHLTQWFVTN